MAVAKKRRRIIIVNGIRYVWYVGEDDDLFLLHLNIISEKKDFIVSCPLKWHNRDNPIMPDHRYIIVKGREFKGTSLPGPWRRYLVPEWDDARITPSLVAAIISWCRTPGPVAEIDWRGRLLHQSL